MAQQAEPIVALTGATGLIGRHVISQLLTLGYRIRALTRERSLGLIGNVELVSGHLEDIPALKVLVEGADYVLNCAGEIHDVSKMKSINCDATIVLASLAADAGVKRFCHVGSAGVIGPTQVAVADESTPCCPQNAYEKSKWTAEQELQRLAQNCSMQIVIARPTNVVDEAKPGLINSLVHTNLKAKASCFVKGAECAHLIHAEDVAAAAIHLTINNVQPGVYFVGFDEEENNTVAGVLSMVNKALGRQSLLENYYLPAQLSHVVRTMRQGKSLHGQTRFSSKKLLNTGFSFPLGLEKAVTNIAKEIQ